MILSNCLFRSIFIITYFAVRESRYAKFFSWSLFESLDLLSIVVYMKMHHLEFQEF